MFSMVKNIKRSAYFESAYLAMQEIVQGIFRLSEAEHYLEEDGYFQVPSYFKERVGKLREVITCVHPPRTRAELEEFLRCFDSGDFSPVIRKKERELEIYYIGASIFEREKTRAKKENSQAV
jgi:hypothetical protein